MLSQIFQDVGAHLRSPAMRQEVDDLALITEFQMISPEDFEMCFLFRRSIFDDARDCGREKCRGCHCRLVSTRLMEQGKYESFGCMNSKNLKAQFGRFILWEG